jgi:hypothetical protein
MRNKSGSGAATPTSEVPTKPELNSLTTVAEAPTKESLKDSIKVNTDVQSVVQNRPQFNQFSPSVRDVAEHAAALKSVLDRLGPIYDMVQREASRMEAVSPLVVGKDQLEEARGRLSADAGKREEKMNAIKRIIEAEKHKLAATINQRLESMIRDVVVNKVKERVKIQVAELVEPYNKIIQGNKGRNMRNKLFLANVEAKNRNSTIRSKFPKEHIAPIYLPINVKFQLPRSPTDSPRVGPAGGYHASPSPKFPENFGALIKLSLPDSITLLKEYNLEETISAKKVPEEARLENLNRLMSHFGIGYRLHPGPPRKGPIITSVWDRR